MAVNSYFSAQARVLKAHMIEIQVLVEINLKRQVSIRERYKKTNITFY